MDLPFVRSAAGVSEKTGNCFLNSSLNKIGLSSYHRPLRLSSASETITSLWVYHRLLRKVLKKVEVRAQPDLSWVVQLLKHFLRLAQTSLLRPGFASSGTELFKNRELEVFISLWSYHQPLELSSASGAIISLWSYHQPLELSFL
jgi:hypothetical protein